MEGLDTGVHPPKLFPSCPSDGNGGLPPTFSPHRSQPAPWHGHRSQARGCPAALDPTLVGRWKPPSITACLAYSPTWQVGLGSGDPLGQGVLGEGVTGKGSQLSTTERESVGSPSAPFLPTPLYH